jgi:biotin-dependent carboxylase-like uncharacterized protein
VISVRALRVLAPGALSTVQDLGRRDVARFGVSPSGAADWYSAGAANLLVGNPANAAHIETTLTGAEFELQCDASIAVTGAVAPLLIDGVPAARWQTHDLRAGAKIEIGAAERGARSYLAIEGGIEVPLVLGSASTDLGAGFGGYRGRALRAGDILSIVARAQNAPTRVPTPLSYAPETIPHWNPSTVLRVLPGPHRSSLSDAAWHELFARSYGVSSRSTRQGLQLEGEPLPLDRPTDVISAGAYAGCVQITSAGLPVILLAEHQTTGGYATAACTIAADVPRAGQLRPGDRVGFTLVSRIDAVHALSRLHQILLSATPASAAELGAGFYEGL